MRFRPDFILIKKVSVESAERIELFLQEMAEFFLLDLFQFRPRPLEEGNPFLCHLKILSDLTPQ